MTSNSAIIFGLLATMGFCFLIIMIIAGFFIFKFVKILKEQKEEEIRFRREQSRLNRLEEELNNKKE